MMTLWARIVCQGSRGSQLVLSSCKTLQTCTRGHSVNFSRQFNHVNKTTSPLFSSHMGPRFLSTSVDVNDGKVIGSTTTDGKTPVEWTGEPDEFTLVLSDEQIQELSGGDPEIIKKIRYIQLEHEIYRQEGHRVPLSINNARWAELILLSSKFKRLKFYEFLYKIEKKKENAKTKTQLKLAKRMEALATEPQLPPLGEDPDGMIYGLNRNTIHIRLRDNTEEEFQYHRIIQEKKFSQPFVLDLDYDRYMSLQEAKNCAKQLVYILTQNRMHPRPLNIVMCNANRNDFSMKNLLQRFPNVYDPDFPVDILDKSYLDLYPKDRLVYLTPHATEELEHFDEDEIYILGCMVDKTDPRPLSIAKAKKEKIRAKKLPLDRYLHWGIGNKCLTLNQIVAIMLDQRFYNDWTKSLLHVPRRKLYGWQGRKEYKDMPFEDTNEEGTVDRRDENQGFQRRNALMGERFRNRDSYGKGEGFERREYGKGEGFEKKREYGNDEHRRRPWNE